MKLKIFLRPSLAIVLGFLGAFIAKFIIPGDIFAITGDYFLAVAVLAFGILGFILPEVVELSGRAGINAMASQIVKYLPNPTVGNLASVQLPFRRRRKKPASNKYVNPMVVDTSALVDGRLLEVTRSGFIFGTFLVIPAVVAELHKLADSSNQIRRGRGRRGLDILSSLVEEGKVKVEMLSIEPDAPFVDEKIVRLAKKIGGKIVTLDYNLNKVARVNKIAILNINELANAVKTAVLPHERLRIQINDRGKGKDQGVGYLEDGTMVVVEGGIDFLGQTLEVDVHRVLQTAAGKMIFAKLAN